VRLFFLSFQNEIAIILFFGTLSFVSMSGRSHKSFQVYRMPFPDNRYAFIRAKLTGLFSYLFYPESQKSGQIIGKRALGGNVGLGGQKNQKKNPPYYLRSSVYGEHTKKQTKSPKMKPTTIPRRKKERRRKKEKEMQSKTCFFFRVKGKIEK